MKVTLITVGRIKEAYLKDAVAEYAKRLSGYLDLRIIEVPDRGARGRGDVADVLEREAADILGTLPASSHVVLLDIDGRQYSSEQLSEHLDDLKLSGHGTFSFVIGGSYGVSDKVRSRADERLSFGKMTLPHNLARVVLLEQLYRCARISRGEPYHK